MLKIIITKIGKGDYIMEKNKISQQIVNFIKNHPIKILVSGTGGISLVVGMSKIITLEYADIIKILSNIKSILINNVAIIMVCICVIVIATYIFILQSRKLKSNEITDQKLIKQVSDIMSKNQNIDSFEIHGHDEKWSILLHKQDKEENSRNNIHVLNNKHDEKNNKETKSN